MVFKVHICEVSDVEVNTVEFISRVIPRDSFSHDNCFLCTLFE